MPRRTVPRLITRIDSRRAGSEREDRVAVEAPLTVVVKGEPVLTTMRTPGEDRELIVGWLHHEGLVGDPRREISRLSICGKPGDSNYGDAYELVPTPAMEARFKLKDPELNRTQFTSCGLCGTPSLQDLVQQTPAAAHHSAASWRAATLEEIFSGLPHLPLFEATGATHFAAVVTTDGRFDTPREDVGRHNAVDKVVGHLALSGRLPPDPNYGLLVSSRASFEVVHKAAVAGFAAVFCISAPTSLAIELAARSNILLAGFFRTGGFNVYSGHSRVVLA